MRTKPLGITTVMKKGLSKPKNTADLLAKKIVQTIWAKTHSENAHHHHSLSPMARIAHATLCLEGDECTKQAKEAARASLADTIELIIREYKGEEIDKTIEISAELKRMVAKAVLEVLSAHIENAGAHELAHILHGEENAIQILHNLTRLQLLDYGIIHSNPQGVNISDKSTSQLWSGHTTMPEYRKNGDTGINIYVEVRPDGTINPVLEGEQVISTVLDEVLVVTSSILGFYEKPELASGNKTGFIAKKLFETPNTIGKFKSVRPLPVANFVKWNGYELYGTESKPNTTVVCIRTKEGETHDSFASNGKIYALNNTILVIEKDTIHVLTQSGKESTPTEVGRIIGIRKNGASEQALYLVINGENKKITIGDTGADIVNIESEEEQFFQETK